MHWQLSKGTKRNKWRQMLRFKRVSYAAKTKLKKGKFENENKRN